MYLTDQPTEDAVNKFSRYSVMNKVQLTALAREVSSVSELNGDMAELGSWLGGSAMVMTTLAPQKRMHAFESFEGLANLGSKDQIREHEGDRGHAVGDFRIDEQQERDDICRRLREAGIDLHVGVFSNSKDEVKDLTFSFCHFDGDTYQSATEFIEFFLPRLVPGGKLVFDDYRWPATPGVECAIHNISSSIVEFVLLTEYQICVKKL